MGNTAADRDREFDRKFSKDVDDNWTGILVDDFLSSANQLRAEARRIVHEQPEYAMCLSGVEPLLERIQRDARDVKQILVEHGLIPVLSREQG